MSEQRRDEDLHSEGTSQDSIRGAQELGQNQPGSKGDGSTPSQTGTESTMGPGGDLGHKRTTL